MRITYNKHSVLEQRHRLIETVIDSLLERAQILREIIFCRLYKNFWII